MSEYVVKEVNAETGEETVREMTDAEITEWLIFQETEQEKAAQKRIAKEEAEELLDSAIVKLAALGLTKEEVKALLG